MDCNALFQGVDADGASRHIRHVGLDLKGVEMGAFAPPCQEEGQDPRAGAEIGAAVPLLHPGEVSQ